MIEAEKANQDSGSIELMCSWAGVSVSGFYSWRKRVDQVAVDAAVFHAEVARVFRASNSTYGYRRVHEQLILDGVDSSERGVRESMRFQGLVSCHPAPWRYCTEQGEGKRPVDLIRREFTASRPGVRFVGDMTQVDTWEGPLFLSTMIDLFNSEVVGWAMADNHHTDLICATVQMAARNGRARRRAVFHSDQGSEYTSKQFARCLRVNRLRGSMGKVATCYDNALAESFFATIKKELIHRTVFPSRAHAMKAIANYIEVWYNRQRLHSSHGYRPPIRVRESYKHTAA
jgi:putative transposase